MANHDPRDPRARRRRRRRFLALLLFMLLLIPSIGTSVLTFALFTDQETVAESVAKIVAALERLGHLPAASAARS